MKYLKAGFAKHCSKECLIFTGVVILLFVFLIARALLVPPVFDEANSFFYFIQNGKFWPFLSEPDTNNHVLYSAFAYLCINCFGDSLFVLRLPNLIAFGVFAYYVFKVSNILQHRFVKWLFRIVLLFTLHIIEFFALGRGYGLSFALYLAASYYILTGSLQNKNSSLFWGFILVFLATMSNLAFVYTFWLLLFWVLLYQFVNRKLYAKAMVTTLLPALFLALFTTGYIFYLKSLNELVAGNSSGLWQTTIYSLFAGLSDSIGIPALANVLALSFCISIVSLVALIVIKNKWNGQKYMSGKYVFLYILLGNIVSVVLTSLLLKVNYPDERIGTHLFLSGSMALFFSIDSLKDSNSRKPWIFIFALPLLFYPLHFAVKANTHYSVWYTSNNIPNRFYTKIAKSANDFPATVAAYHIKSLCWALADYNRGGNQNPIFWNSYPAPIAEFLIVEKPEAAAFTKKYQEIDFDKVSNCSLLKRNSDIAKKLIYQNDMEGSNNKISNEFVSLIEIDSLFVNQTSMRIDFEIDITSYEYPFHAMVVVSAEDSLHNAVAYEYLRCNHQRGNWEPGTPALRNSLLLYQLPETTKKLKVYIWNQNAQKFTIRKSKVRVWGIE